MAWFLWMAVYYGFRLFALTPWYDELYTYYYFISRGPVYAAIHWPLPNNHVGYSTLSAVLNWLGNPYIGLRGVSYLCALANLALLYRIGRKRWGQGWSFCCVALYSGMNLVNQLAVQGRGYALATTCFLLAVYMIEVIGFGQEKGIREEWKHYMIFSLSLTLGLYVLPSSVYWTLPVCIAGGVFLLLQRQIKKLLYLIGASAVAAVNAFLLYAVIWLAIGSNLLSKVEGGRHFGQGHVSIILSAPFQAMKTGMDYMLDTPYIQSVAREGYAAAFGIWLRSLLSYFYSNAWRFLAVAIVAGTLAMTASFVKAYREGKAEPLFFSIFLICMMTLTPLILVIQCKLPYFRVFSYMGAPLAMLLCALLQMAVCSVKGCLQRRKKPGSADACGQICGNPAVQESVWNLTEPKRAGIDRNGIFCMTVCGILAVAWLLSAGYNQEYGITESYAKDALAHAWVEEKETICVTDCYQQYLLQFGYGITCENMQIEGSDLVLLHREMLERQPGNARWEFYQNYDSIPWDYIAGMDRAYENEEYIVYVK